MQIDEIMTKKIALCPLTTAEPKPIAYQYKCRKNNGQKYNECCRKSQKEYYQKNKERISAWKKEWYLKKKAQTFQASLHVHSP